MPHVEVTIGGRNFEVACQEGEEPFLRTAAQLLDTEASALTGQIGRMPAERMLLMAGLMLADKTAGVEDRLRDAEARAAELTARLGEIEARPPPEAARVEVPVVPGEVADTLAEIAARAEALADALEGR